MGRIDNQYILISLDIIWAWSVEKLATPLKYSTPLVKARYRKIASFAKRCLFFYRKGPQFRRNSGEILDFSILHKKITTFLDTIRGPPSEI